MRKLNRLPQFLRCNTESVFLRKKNGVKKNISEKEGKKGKKGANQSCLHLQLTRTGGSIVPITSAAPAPHNISAPAASPTERTGDVDTDGLTVFSQR